MPCENIVITIEETNEIIEIVVNDFSVSNILSSDANNYAEFGTDGKIYVPTPSEGISNHSELNLDDGTNPHGTTKSDVGLGNVPNLDTTSAINNEHTHSNKTILDNTTESFTTALKTAYDNVVTWVSTNGTNLLNHLTNFSNPHNVTKSQVGLGNVDNTSNAELEIYFNSIYKPLSEVLITNPSVSGTYNVDWSAASVWRLTLTGSTTLTFSNLPPSGFTDTITLNIDGNETLSYPADVTDFITGAYDGATTLNTITIQYIGVNEYKVVIVQPD